MGTAMGEVLNFLQCNIHHAKVASQLLKAKITSGQCDIALIQEPWIANNSVQGLKVHEGRLYVSDHERPRACIFVTDRVESIPLLQYTSQDCAVVQLRITRNKKRHDFILISAYFPYDSVDSPPPEEFQSAIRYARSKGLPVIAGVDANAHNRVWGSTDDNDRGEDLLEYLTTADLQILNRGDSPTFVTTNRREVLDLTLATDAVRYFISGWRVLSEESGSDHRYITFKMEIDSVEEVRYRNPRRTDWVYYSSILHQQLGDTLPVIETKPELDSAVCRLLNSIQSAFNASCPESVGRNRKAVRWFTPDLIRERKQLRKLFTKA